LLLICPYFANAEKSLPEFQIMTENWKPYNYSENGKIKGLSTDILILMLKKTGSTQGREDIKIYPWARSYKIALLNPDTILYSTVRTKKRDKIFKWVGPITEIKLNIYALKEKNIEIDSFEDMKKYKIGTLRDDVTEDMLAEITGMDVKEFQQVHSNILNTRKLYFGRVDLIAQSRDTLLATCKREGLDPERFEAVTSLGTKDLYYAFHKSTSEVVIKTFQNAFDDLKKNGKVSEILNKYGK